MPKSVSNWHNRTPDKRYSEKRWLILRASILARSTLCGICGHGGEHGSPAGSVDHIEAAEVAPERFYDPANLQPAHNYRNPCRVCREAYRANGYDNKGDCQSLRGSQPVPVARERIYRKTGLRYGQLPGQPAPEISVAGCPYKTVQEAVDDLESTPGKADLARDDAAQVWAWQEAGLLSCKCGPATGEESAACWVCNPLIRPLRG